MDNRLNNNMCVVSYSWKPKPFCYTLIAWGDLFPFDRSMSSSLQFPHRCLPHRQALKKWHEQLIVTGKESRTFKWYSVSVHSRFASRMRNPLLTADLPYSNRCRISIWRCLLCGTASLHNLYPYYSSPRHQNRKKQWHIPTLSHPSCWVMLRVELATRIVLQKCHFWERNQMWVSIWSVYDDYSQSFSVPFTSCSWTDAPRPHAIHHQSRKLSCCPWRVRGDMEMYLRNWSGSYQCLFMVYFPPMSLVLTPQ